MSEIGASWAQWADLELRLAEHALVAASLGRDGERALQLRPRARFVALDLLRGGRFALLHATTQLVVARALAIEREVEAAELLAANYGQYRLARLWAIALHAHVGESVNDSPPSADGVSEWVNATPFGSRDPGDGQSKEGETE
jgi:hypothetical protein